MSCSRFLSIAQTFFVAAVCTIASVFPVQAAEWRACEKAKLREIQLEHHVDSPKPSRHKKHRRNQQDRHASVEEIDTWLWKNCREFSYELRQLEQEKM